MATRTRWSPHLTGSLKATCRNTAAPAARRQVRGWLLGISVTGLILFEPGTLELIRLSIRQHQLDRRLAALKTKREQLTQEQVRLQTDPTYLEGLIRSTFKLAQPGEYVIPLDRDHDKDISALAQRKQ